MKNVISNIIWLAVMYIVIGIICALLMYEIDTANVAKAIWTEVNLRTVARVNGSTYEWELARMLFHNALDWPTWVMDLVRAF